MRTIILAALLPLLACKKSDGAVVPAAAAAAPSLEAGWWTNRELAQVPVRSLAAVEISGADWVVVAQTLGMDPGQFSADEWGPHDVMAHGPSHEQDLAIYLDEPGNQGFIVRALTIDGDIPDALERVAAAAGHGSTWTHYLDGEYQVLVSQQQPVIELGCLRELDENLCHVYVTPAHMTIAGWEQLRGRGTAEKLAQVEL